MVRRWPVNVSYNCLDRHLGTPTANKAALIWEGEPAGPGKPGEERTFTTSNSIHDVCQLANVSSAWHSKGDRILSTCPWFRKPRIAMLACTRIGAFIRGLRRLQRPIGCRTAFSIAGTNGNYCRRRLPPRGSWATKTKVSMKPSC